MPMDEDRAKDGEEFVRRYALGERCHAGRDGECGDVRCPRERDGEPGATGRHCPLDPPPDDDYWGY